MSQPAESAGSEPETPGSEPESAESKPGKPPPPPMDSGGGGDMSYDDAFELTGRGMFSYKVLVASCLIFNHAIIEMVAIGYVITPAECDMNLTVYEKSMIGSAIYMGIMVTSVFWGYVTDRFGRRRIMMPCVFGSVVSSFISSLCNSFWPMFIFRLITGFLVSAPSAAIFVYLGELQTNAFRDYAISIVVTSAQLFFLIFPAIAWAIIPGTWSFNLGILIRPWRVFMWTWGIWGLIGGGILITLPDSPKFLRIKKGSAAALPILARIYAENLKKTPEEYPVSSIAEKEEHKANMFQEFLQLLKAPMLKVYLLTHFSMFMTFMLANGLYVWLPDFINMVLSNINLPYSMCDLINAKYMQASDYDDYSLMSFAGDKQETTEEQQPSDDCAVGEVNMFVYPIAMGCEAITLVPFLIVTFYIHKVNKIKMYAIIMGVNSVCLVLCSFVPNMTCALILFMLGLCSGSCCSLLSTLAVEIFPTTLRGIAMCTMYCAGHLGAIAGTSVINGMVDEWCYVHFVMVAAMATASGLLMVFMWPDVTKVKEEMEAIQFTY